MYTFAVEYLELNKTIIRLDEVEKQATKVFEKHLPLLPLLVKRKRAVEEGGEPVTEDEEYEITELEADLIDVVSTSSGIHEDYYNDFVELLTRSAYELENYFNENESVNNITDQLNQTTI